MIKKTLLGFGFGLSLAFVTVFPFRASALTLTPPRLEVSGDPGSTINTKRTVINDQNSIGTYFSSFANFEAQGDSGVPALSAATDDLGTWMKVPDSLTLGAGDSKDIDVSITIPKNATPGGHFAAIFWGTQPAGKNSGSIGIAMKTGVLVLLSVKGDVKEGGTVSAFDTVSALWWVHILL